MLKFALAVLMILTVLAASAHAATPVTKDAANKFYATCLNSADASMSADSHNAMCACAAAEITRGMTQDDLDALKGGDQPARLAMNKMLINVYAPCLTEPVRDVITARCEKNGKMKAAGAVKTCACVTKLTGDWYALSARELMVKALKTAPGMTDPLTPIMHSAQFQSEETKNIQACLREP